MTDYAFPVVHVSLAEFKQIMSTDNVVYGASVPEMITRQIERAIRALEDGPPLPRSTPYDLFFTSDEYDAVVATGFDLSPYRVHIENIRFVSSPFVAPAPPRVRAHKGKGPSRRFPRAPKRL